MLKNVIFPRVCVVGWGLVLSFLLPASIMAQTMYVDFIVNQSYSGCDAISAQGVVVINGTPFTGGTVYLQRWSGSAWNSVAGSSRTVNSSGQMAAPNWSITQSGTYRVMGTVNRPGGGTYPTEPNRPFGANFTVNNSAVAITNINGNAAAFPTVINVYNCQNIFLNSLSIGFSQHQIEVIRTDASGTTITVVHNTGWLFVAAPTQTNLATLTSNAINTPGYYKVILRGLSSTCGGVSEKISFVRVLSAPGPASFDFRMWSKPTSSGGYTAANRSTNILSPVLGGYTQSGICSTQNVTNVEEFRILLEQVNCATGAVIQTINNEYSNWTVAPGGNIPPSLTINDITDTYYPPAGYLIANIGTVAGTCYKITVTVRNVCDANGYTLYSYCKINNYAKMFMGEDEETGNENASLMLWPNPASDHLVISGIEGPQAEIRIFNVAGAVVLLQQTNAISAAAQTQLNVSELAAGIYVVEVQSGNTVYRDRFIKQ